MHTEIHGPITERHTSYVKKSCLLWQLDSEPSDMDEME